MAREALKLGAVIYLIPFMFIAYPGMLAGGSLPDFLEAAVSGIVFTMAFAMFFGGANPFWGWIGCLIFGFADSLGSRLQSLGLPSQFILMIPYVVTVVVLTLAMIRKKRAETARKSAI